MIGRVIGKRYRILAEMGRGGMGIVYLASDQKVKGLVAVKTLPATLAYDREFLRRFQQEARALAALDHPNIVRLIETFEESGSQYIVMEYVEGQTLRQLLASGPMAAANALDLAIQVCRALSYAHSRGIIHRDIKADNIMVAKDGTVKVTDFGIARMVDATLQTRSGMAFMSLETVPPEVIRGQKADERYDIYSLGVVLYQMLTGEAPFMGGEPAALMYHHINTTPTPPSSQNARVPEWLDRVVFKCLAKDPQVRYQEVEELSKDLTQDVVVAPRSQSEPATVLLDAPLRKKAKGRSGTVPVAVGVLAAVLVVPVVMGLALVAGGSGGSSGERTVSREAASRPSTGETAGVKPTSAAAPSLQSPAPISPKPTATPTTVPRQASPTATIARGIASAPGALEAIRDAISACNAAEIRALRTVDLSPLRACLGGEALAWAEKRFAEMKAKGSYEESVQQSITFLSFNVSSDGNKARVETRETYLRRIYARDGTVTSLNQKLKEDYWLEKVGGRWVIVRIDITEER